MAVQGGAEPSRSKLGTRRFLPILLARRIVPLPPGLLLNRLAALRAGRLITSQIAPPPPLHPRLPRTLAFPLSVAAGHLASTAHL